MDRLNTAFVLGYHGCDKTVGERLLAGEGCKQSENEYDWLGPGIYFWEGNPRRGLDFASELKILRRGPKIIEPFVIGAVIELGTCLDLTSASAVKQVRDAYDELMRILEKGGGPLPENSQDLLRRNLDCAVIRHLHNVRERNDDIPIETLRGVFIEGDSLYPNSGFYAKTHIQVCVRNPDNIKGVFRVASRFLD